MLRAFVVVALVGCSHHSAAAIDAAVDVAALDAPLSCPTSDAATGCAPGQFCEIFSGGVAPAGCTTLPSACASTQTCACLMAETICGGDAMLCRGSSDQIVVTCEGI